MRLEKGKNTVGFAFIRLVYNGFSRSVLYSFKMHELRDNCANKGGVCHKSLVISEGVRRPKFLA